ISIARKNPRGRQIILNSICEYLQEKEFPYDIQLVEETTHFEDDYTDDGYGRINEEIQQLIKQMLIRNGIPMDSTYTAKAYTGMKKYLREHKIHNKNILFIHTGGMP